MFTLPKNHTITSWLSKWNILKLKCSNIKKKIIVQPSWAKGDKSSILSEFPCLLELTVYDGMHCLIQVN